MAHAVETFLRTRSRPDAGAAISAAKAMTAADRAGLSPDLRYLADVFVGLNVHEAARELSTTAASAHSAFLRSHRTELLRCAVVLGQLAVLAEGPDPNVALLNRIQLGSILQTNFHHQYDLGSLFESVTVLRDVFNELTTLHVLWTAAATQLAIALVISAEHQLENVSLVEAEALYQDVFRLVPHHPEIGAEHHNYADLLRVKYQREKDPALLEAKIEQHRLAVERSPDGHPADAIRRTALANALLNRCLLTGGTNDLDLALDVLAKVPAAGTVLPPVDLTILRASFLLLRYDSLRRADDLEASRRLLIEASGSVDPAHAPAAVQSLTGLHLLIEADARRSEEVAAEAFKTLIAAVGLDRTLTSPRWALLALAEAWPGSSEFTATADRLREDTDRWDTLDAWQSDPSAVVAKRYYLRRSGSLG
ncbi:hypothetical protein [Kribbella amoyensis]|nr:hypothetical protein [Kribbella amoyensis]